MYSIFFRQVYLICVIIDFFEDMERTISLGTKFEFPLSRESILPKVKPNPIPFLKNYLSFPLITMFQVFLYLLLYLILNSSCIFLTNSAFVTPSLCTNSCGLGRGNKSKGVRGLNPYTTSNGEILVV